MKNWKTTLAGVIGLLVVAATQAKAALLGGTPDWTLVLAGIPTCLGLIFAKDSNVTGGTVAQ